MKVSTLSPSSCFRLLNTYGMLVNYIPSLDEVRIELFFYSFYLGTLVPRHSAGSIGLFDRTAVRTTLIVFITNDTALHMLEQISHVQNSIANREFPVSIQVQECGETGLYALQGANYTATLWFTLVKGA